MDRKKDITVVMTTYNRSAVLWATLEAMCAVDREGLNVEFAVVDNNSTDDTSQVIDSFAERLPLQHLFEPRQGQNCGQNHAFNSVELGEIVVVTDDDVVPRKDWLKQIFAACEKWPDYDVFGGKIELIWPEAMPIPNWARENEDIRGGGFAEHDLGDEDMPYAPGSAPSGPNFWLRGKVLRDGARLDESLWTRPGPRFCMGLEKEFLLRLAAEGKRLLYAPGAAVGHRVQVSLLTPRNMLKRAIRYGAAGPHTFGLPDPEKLAKSPWSWRARRILKMTWHLNQFLCAYLRRDESIRMKNAVEALRNYGYHREALSMSWDTE